ANSVRPLTSNEILHPKLSVTGKLVKRKLTEIAEHYPDVFVEMSCIMPDHVHIIIKIEKQPKNGRTLFAPTSETPTLSRVIKHFKEAVTKELGYSIWQKSFYDTIIKNRKQHAEIRQ
ncbi:transposase, partial [Ruminococcus sp.]